jgi:hypothetical protein
MRGSFAKFQHRYNSNRLPRRRKDAVGQHPILGLHAAKPAAFTNGAQPKQIRMQ